MSRFIKIGDTIINPAQIVSIYKNGESVIVTLTSLTESLEASFIGSEEPLAVSVSETIEFEGEAAAALLRWAIGPDQCVDLLPANDPDSVCKSHYQQHRSRGGPLEFQQFKRKFNKHQELCQMSGATDTQVDQTIALEGELRCF
jgi:hypothetical protein